MKFRNYLILLTVLLAGCATNYSRWEREAGRIYLDHLDDTQPYWCRYRVRDLAKKMEEAGETFEVCFGFHRGEAHTWIIHNGILIDPSVGWVVLTDYTKVSSVYYAKRPKIY